MELVDDEARFFCLPPRARSKKTTGLVGSLGLTEAMAIVALKVGN